MNNPWAGLASYQDPAGGSTLLFCGRDNESYDLAALVDDNIFCTLYGKSGTGKTSLLNAGVFPRLRAMGYLPVSIRLGMEAMDTTFQQCIVNRLAQVADLQTTETVAMPADDQDEQWLWTWFARTRFVDGDGKTRFAVLVFDQFEEVFRSRRDEAEALLRQIHFMVDPSHSLGESYDYNFRFLASIREDDLYLLEDSLDRNFMGDMKQCRYRLNALTDEGARDVILKPGAGLFVAGEQEEIVDTVIGIARSADGTINTNILSLVCSRIFEEYYHSGASSISIELVRRFVSGNPFEQFYREVTRNLGEKEKRFIEDRLVDAAGRRGSVSEPDFEKNVPSGAHLLEGTGRILQRVASGTEGRSYRIELIHDSFCAPLADQKLKRAARRRRKIIIAVTALALVVAAIAAYIVVMSIRNARQTREILIQQEKFYAYRASQLLDEGDTYTALLLLNELTDPDGQFAKIPLQPEAELQMRRAVQMYENAEWRVECAYQIPRGRFHIYPKVSLDGKYMIEVTLGKLLIYDFNTGRLFREVAISDYNIPTATISHNCKKVALNDGLGIDFVNIEKGEIRARDITILSDGEEGYVTRCIGSDNLIFSSNDEWVFGIADTIINLNSGQKQTKLMAISVEDSSEFYLQGGENVTSIESGNDDGSRLAAMNLSGEIIIYDKKTFQLLHRFNVGDCVYYKYISDDILLFVQRDGLYRYSISRKEMRKIDNRFYDCSILGDVQTASDCFCLSKKDSVFIHDRKTLSLVNTYVVDTAKYLAVSLHNGGKLFLMSRDQKKIVLVGHHSKESPMEVSPTDRDERYLNGGRRHISTNWGIGDDCISVFQVRDVESNRILFSDTTDVQRDIESISPNEKYVILKEFRDVLDAQGKIVVDEYGFDQSYWLFRLFDLEKLRWIHTFDTTDFKGYLFFTNEDNCIFYPRGYIGKQYCYDINTGIKTPFFTDSLADSVGIWNLVTSSNSDNLVVARSSHLDTRLFNVKTHQMRVVWGKEFPIVRFTPDGKRVLTISKDNIIRLHDASDFSVLDSCNSTVAGICDVHKNGKMFVAQSNQKKLELWTIFPLRRVGEIVIHDYVAEDWREFLFSFCDDGKNLVFYSANPDGFFKIPILTQQEVVEKARAVTNGHKLTEEEKNLLME